MTRDARGLSQYFAYSSGANVMKRISVSEQPPITTCEMSSTTTNSAETRQTRSSSCARFQFPMDFTLIISLMMMG
jgi:hypothetical protein